MGITLTRNRRVFEVMLVTVVLGMATLLSQMGGQKMAVLSLFFLPIVLSGFYLGRTSACVLALFCALSVTIVVTLDPVGFAAFDTPLMMGLAITLWAATLGLTAILVGTLCDDRAATVGELHNAYVGVVEVLSRYLQAANSGVKARSHRIAELSQRVAEEMNLSPRQIDDVRVAALLQDLGHVEITTQIISKAVTALETDPSEANRHTFLGTDLVHSLSRVLHGALPLLLSEEDKAGQFLRATGDQDANLAPRGAKIIQAVRAYEALISGGGSESALSSREALQALGRDTTSGYEPEVLRAMDRVVRRSEHAFKPEPVAC